jgi:hypothetical protein
LRDRFDPSLLAAPDYTGKIVYVPYGFGKIGGKERSCAEKYQRRKKQDSD